MGWANSSPLTKKAISTFDLANCELESSSDNIWEIMVKGGQIESSLPEKLNLGSYLLDVNLESGRGGKTAIYYRERTYGFLDLWRLTNNVGNVLRELGVEPENRVLLILEDSPEWVGVPGWVHAPGQSPATSA